MKTNPQARRRPSSGRASLGHLLPVSRRAVRGKSGTIPAREESRVSDCWRRRRHADRSPSTRHSAYKSTRKSIFACAALWRVLHFVPPLRVTAIGRRGLLAAKTFCCRNRPFGRFEQQNVLVAKRPSTRGRVNIRGATGEAGLMLTLPRVDGSGVGDFAWSLRPWLLQGFAKQF